MAVLVTLTSEEYPQMECSGMKNVNQCTEIPLFEQFKATRQHYVNHKLDSHNFYSQLLPWNETWLSFLSSLKICSIVLKKNSKYSKRKQAVLLSSPQTDSDRVIHAQAPWVTPKQTFKTLSSSFKLCHCWKCLTYQN